MVDVPALVLGVLSGLSGAVQFLHANLVLQFSNSFFAPEAAALFAVVLSFSRLPWEALASIFFAVPSPSQSASVLPAHRLVLSGLGLCALRAVFNSFSLSLFFCVILLPVALFFVPPLYSLVRPAVPFSLLLLVLAVFLSEKSLEKTFFGAVVFLLSGALGFALLSFPLVNEPLFPLLTGLFGFSSLFLALSENEKIPFQKGGSAPRAIFPVLLGSLLGFFSCLVPAVTPAFLASCALFFFEATPLSFISLNAAIVFSKTFFDFVSVATIHKARSGAAVALASFGDLAFPFLATLLALGASAFFLHLLLVSALSRPLVDKVSSLNPRKLSLGLFFFLAFSVLLVCGPMGLFASAVAASVGLLPHFLGVRRAYSLGSLMAPTLLYYSGLNYFLVSLIR